MASDEQGITYDYFSQPLIKQQFVAEHVRFWAA